MECPSYWVPHRTFLNLECSNLPFQFQKKRKKWNPNNRWQSSIESNTFQCFFFSFASNLLISLLLFIVIVSLGLDFCCKSLYLAHSYCYILLIVVFFCWRAPRDDGDEPTCVKWKSSSGFDFSWEWESGLDSRCVFGLGPFANKVCDIQSWRWWWWWWWWWCWCWWCLHVKLSPWFIGQLVSVGQSRLFGMRRH